MNNPDTPKSTENQLPHEVVAALRRQNGPPQNVPKSIDDMVLADAVAHLNKIRRPASEKLRQRNFAWVAWSTGTLAAAVLLLALMPMEPQQPARSPTSIAMNDAATINETAGDFVMGDVDQNGQVDILDAFALARTVESGDDQSARWDQNDDGTTDHSDINLIAMNAVML